LPLAAILAEVLTPALFRRWLERLDQCARTQSSYGWLDAYLHLQLPHQPLRVLWLPWSRRHYLAATDGYLPLEDWINTYLIKAGEQAQGALTPEQALAWLDESGRS
jgi:hypothetical protein